MNSKISIGVSRCLLGDDVRYDGGHKRSRYLTDILTDYFDWVSVCPEVEAGLGTPRPAIRLVQVEDSIRVLGPDKTDHTDVLDAVADKRLPQLRREKIRGFILKKDSPSCGMSRVRRYVGKHPQRDGVGVFAARLVKAWPNLPCEEEGRLNDSRLRENFIQRVFTYSRWRDFVEASPTVSGLMAFHAAHKYLLLSHNQTAARELGRLVAIAAPESLPEQLEQYETRMMSALSRPTSVKKQINTIQHLLGFVKNELSSAEKQEFLDLVDQYRQGIIPLITPLTMLRHHLTKVDSAWARSQVYLQPYPRGPALRSHLK